MALMAIIPTAGYLLAKARMWFFKLKKNKFTKVC